MALSRYTGGGLSNRSASSYYVPTMPISSLTTPTPRYNSEPTSWHRSNAIEQKKRHEERRTRERDLLSAKALLAYHPERDAVKQRRKREQHGKQQKLRQEKSKEWVQADSSQQPVLQVNAQCGDDVTLPCAAPRPDSVDGLEWTRTDLDQYVYLLKDGEAALKEQHEAYRGRVELKDGTAAMSLRNVTSKDNGKYECRYVIQGSGVSKRSIISSEPVSVVKLRVTQTGAVGACGGAEDEDDDDADKNKIRVIGEGEDNPEFMRFMRHHYVTFGVMGAFGLVVVAITFLMVL